jgi:hypothetical protein
MRLEWPSGTGRAAYGPAFTATAVLSRHPVGDSYYTGCAYGYGDLAPFTGPCDCPVCNGSGVEAAYEPNWSLVTLMTCPAQVFSVALIALLHAS